MAGQFLNEKNQVGIPAAQAVPGVNQNGLDASFCRQVPDPFEPRAFENGTLQAVILNDPVRRDVVPVLSGVCDQRLGLAGDRVALFVLVARRFFSAPKMTRPRSSSASFFTTDTAGKPTGPYTL